MDNRPKRNKETQNNIETRPLQQVQQSQMNQPQSNYPNFNTDLEERARQLESSSKGKKKWLILKIFVAIVLIVALYFGYKVLSTGMNDKRVTDLNNEVTSLQQTIQNKDSTIEELKQAVNDTTVKEVVPVTSLQRVEATDVPELYLIEGDFIAPNKLEIPTAKDDINNSFIQIGSRFKFTPSDSWIIISRGTTVEFTHPTKIWGKIKAITYKERVPEIEMQDIVKNFFVGYPATTITYRKIFIGDYVVGVLGEAQLTMKTEGGSSKEVVVTTGFIQRGDYGLNLLFVYDKDNIVGKELWESLIRSGVFGEDKIKLE